MRAYIHKGQENVESDDARSNVKRDGVSFQVEVGCSCIQWENPMGPSIQSRLCEAEKTAPLPFLFLDPKTGLPRLWVHPYAALGVLLSNGCKAYLTVLVII
jgi:hypothetical protein